jgi:hypothetical protein
MRLRSLLARLLPHRRTTPEKARRGLISCGINPDEIAWSVGEDGSFTFGSKNPDAGGLTYGQTIHILAWARRERLKVDLIDWP